VSATAVSLCRLQQALKRDPQVHPTTHLNALFGQFVEQQVAARRREFSGRPWRPDNGSCRSSPLPPDTPRKPHGAAFIRLTPLRLRGVRLAIDCLNCHPIEIEPHVECDRAIARRVQAAAGFGVIAEQATGYPGYDSFITRDKATIGRILKDNGYRTSWFGKDHNTPDFQASQDGPFDQWPIGMGFEYFYGFIGGTPASGSRTCFAMRPRFILILASPAGTSSPPWRTMRLRI
jgi:hypothetical protein